MQFWHTVNIQMDHVYCVRQRVDGNLYRLPHMVLSGCKLAAQSQCAAPMRYELLIRRGLIPTQLSDMAITLLADFHGQALNGQVAEMSILLLGGMPMHSPHGLLISCTQPRLTCPTRTSSLLQEKPCCQNDVEPATLKTTAGKAVTLRGARRSQYYCCPLQVCK